MANHDLSLDFPLTNQTPSPILQISEGDPFSNATYEVENTIQGVSMSVSTAVEFNVPMWVYVLLAVILILAIMYVLGLLQTLAGKLAAVLPNPFASWLTTLAAAGSLVHRKNTKYRLHTTSGEFISLKQLYEFIALRRKVVLISGSSRNVYKVSDYDLKADGFVIKVDPFGKLIVYDWLVDGDYIVYDPNESEYLRLAIPSDMDLFMAREE